MTSPASGDAVLERLAAQLLQAHRRIGQMDVSAEQKAGAARRLVAISDAAKHDVARAAARLEVLLADWDAGRIGARDDHGGDG